jgi:hypothetical protein
MRKYYILYETNNSTHWRIRNTHNNLETDHGLLNEIRDIEAQHDGKQIVIISWKELNLKGGIKGFFQRLFWGIS